MTNQLFKKTTFSFVYHKHMLPVSKEVFNMVLSYVKEKARGQPLEIAVDVGCGTGRSTLPLAPHFKKVLGIDMSVSQIDLAKHYNSANNISYITALAEKLPINSDSVDLVNADLAAHWFPVEEFTKEAARILKKNGCLAVHAFYPATEIEYKDLSDDLNVVMSETWNTLFPLVDPVSIDHMLSQYCKVFESVPLSDKKWIKDIPVQFQMSISEIVGFFRTVYMFQIFLEKDEKGAEEFIRQTERRMQDILGKNADSVRLKVHMKNYCVLACKD